jgi:hypothetical protein
MTVTTRGFLELFCGLVTVVACSGCSAKHAHALGRGHFNSSYTLHDCPRVRCDGNPEHDDTGALNACVAALPDGSTLEFPDTAQCVISNTIELKDKFNITLIGKSYPYLSGPTIGPVFQWNGPEGGTMMRVDRIHGGALQGLNFFPRRLCKPGYNAADTGIIVDQTSVESQRTMTGFVIRDVSISLCGGAKSNFVGISFSPVSNKNVEHIKVENVVVACGGGSSLSSKNGRGIVMSGSANQLGYVYDNVHLVSCGYGIDAAAGAATMINAAFQNNAVAVNLGGGVHQWTILGADAENNKQFLITHANGSINVISSRIAASKPNENDAIIESQHSTVIMTGSRFDYDENVTVFKCSDEAGVVSTGNIYPAHGLTNTGWRNCASNSISLGDKVTNGVGAGLRAMGFAMTGSSHGRSSEYDRPYPFPDLGAMYYDITQQKWMISENGASFTPVRAGGTPIDPGCTCASDIGKQWFDTSAKTTVYKVCLQSGDRYEWVVK